MTTLSCFSIFSFFYHFSIFTKNVFCLFPFCALSNIFHCKHQCPSFAADVSFVVGAPWRCGVLTTLGRIGPGHLPKREYASTPQSGVRSLPRLDCCCHYPQCFVFARRRPLHICNTSRQWLGQTGVMVVSSWGWRQESRRKQKHAMC